jgi:hypothetical protein
MDILSLFGVATGSALLFFGRRLYWLLVVGLGSVTGYIMSLHYGLTPRDVLLWVIAGSSGIGAVLLARLLPRAGIWAFGCLAGAYSGGLILLVLNFRSPSPNWSVQIVAACIGMFCFGLWFEAGIAVFTVLIGAGLISITLDLGVPARPLVYLTLLSLGLVCQKRLASPPKKDATLVGY